jgi:hypothetical protein
VNVRTIPFALILLHSEDRNAGRTMSAGSMMRPRDAPPDPSVVPWRLTFSGSRMHLQEPSPDPTRDDPPAPPGRIAADPAAALRLVAEDVLERIARGERPDFRVHWRWDGTAVEIAVDDLPGVHAFAPTRADVERAAHHRIAAQLHLPADAFDVTVVDAD